jgi:hypothetical protein
MDRLLEALEPFAAIKDKNMVEKTFSHAAKVKMTTETKEAVAELWTELHEAMYLDKRIKFRKPNPTIIQL